MDRKKFMLFFGFVLGTTAAFPATLLKSLTNKIGNFKYIYSNNKLRKEFYNFLVHVFNLFPEEQLHELITKSARKNSSDQEIYLEVQTNLQDITPCFSSLTYKLPSLFKQKDEMARQTLMLLGEGSAFDGYLEIGSSGRYLDYLEEKVNIAGERYYADGREPGYSLTEIIDRGQFSVGATYLPMTNYRTNYASVIPLESLDLVSVYIGFHHCPIALRRPFISSIRDTMRVGGKLILRDHDCKTEDQRSLVALAHDVFNMGTLESWEYNEREERNFYSLDFIIHFVEDLGFKFHKRTLFQKGDPTKNALMLFTKTDV